MPNFCRIHSQLQQKIIKKQENKITTTPKPFVFHVKEKEKGQIKLESNLSNSSFRSSLIELKCDYMIPKPTVTSILRFEFVKNSLERKQQVKDTEEKNQLKRELKQALLREQFLNSNIILDAKKYDSKLHLRRFQEQQAAMEYYEYLNQINTKIGCAPLLLERKAEKL